MSAPIRTSSCEILTDITASGANLIASRLIIAKFVEAGAMWLFPPYSMIIGSVTYPLINPRIITPIGGTVNIIVKSKGVITRATTVKINCNFYDDLKAKYSPASAIADTKNMINNVMQ